MVTTCWVDPIKSVFLSGDGIDFLSHIISSENKV